MTTVLDGTARMRQYLRNRLTAGISLSGLMLSSIPAPLNTFLKYDLPEGSNPVGATRHDASGAAHQRAHRRRRTHAARGRGRGTMCDLLRSHGFKYRTAAGITCRKSVEMLIEVAFD